MQAGGGRGGALPTEPSRLAWPHMRTWPGSSSASGLDNDLTQEALAERVGTSKAAISRLESGRHAPTAETLRKIARAFGGHLVIGSRDAGLEAQETRTVLARVS